MNLKLEISSIKEKLTTLLGCGYLLVESQIGNTTKELGYHGFIAVFVYIHVSLFISNLIRLQEIVKTTSCMGINLVVTRASNKVESLEYENREEYLCKYHYIMRQLAFQRAAIQQCAL